MVKTLATKALAGGALVLIMALATAQARPAGAIFQISTDSETTWKVAVRNARNLQAAMRPKPIRIEIIVFGPGLKMLLKGSPVAPNLMMLHKGGVVIEARKDGLKKLGITPDQVLPIVHYIRSGIAELVERERQGWAYIRP